MVPYLPLNLVFKTPISFKFAWGASCLSLLKQRYADFQVLVFEDVDLLNSSSYK